MLESSGDLLFTFLPLLLCFFFYNVVYAQLVVLANVPAPTSPTLHITLIFQLRDKAQHNSTAKNSYKFTVWLPKGHQIGELAFTT